MAGINFLGSYSGIDQSVIDKLMQYEKLPIKQLTAKKTTITSQKDAWKDVNTRLNSLYNRLKDLQNPATFNSMAAKVGSDKGILSATASKDAIAGKYDIEVKSLATNTRVVSEGTVGAVTDGKFNIKNADGLTFSVEVGSVDTLQDIAKNINEASKNVEVDGKKVGANISATVINDRLVITDEKVGNRAIEFNNEDDEKDVIGSLKLKDSIGGENGNQGKQAHFLINGVEGFSNSNTLKDNVLGLTINLNKIGTETITVGADTEKITKAIQDFVDQYNSTLGFIEEQTAAGTVSAARNADGLYETVGRGTLAGESSLKSLQDSLKRMVTDAFAGSDIKNIAQLGITTSSDKSGRLSFNSSKFMEEFEKDPMTVQNFFNREVDGPGGKVNTGFVSKLNDRIDRYISTKDGLIKNKNESLDKTLKDINDRIEVFNDRITRKEQYYVKTFAALEVAMMKAESQMEWLQGQISSMNAQVRK